MSEERLVPKLRFSGYTDNFESGRLEDVCEVKGRIGFRGYTKSDLVGKNEGALTLGGKHINSNDKLNLDDPDYLSWEKYEESPEIKVKVGDIILAQRGTLGQSALIDRDIGKATINPSMVLLKDFKINNIFLHYLLTTSKLKKEVIRKSSSTAVPMISQAEIKKLKINYPSSSEQEKIGHFFKIIDNKLELLKNKLKSYQDFKKYLMQQIFAQKLRFIDFNDEWVSKKLGEIVEFLDNKRIPLNEDQRNSQKDIYPYYGASGIIDYVEDYIFDEELILIGEDGTIDVNLASGKYWVSNHAHVLRAKDNINQYFLSEFLKTINFEIYNTGTIQPKLNKETCKSIPIKLPVSLDEQNKIADLFFDVNEKLKYIQNELAEVQRFKNGLLQQMFV